MVGNGWRIINNETLSMNNLNGNLLGILMLVTKSRHCGFKLF